MLFFLNAGDNNEKSRALFASWGCTAIGLI